MENQISTQMVWESLSQRIRAFIASRVNDHPQQDDLLQDTFLKIHQRIGSIDDHDRLAAWVFQVARNTVYDHYRSRGNGIDADSIDAGSFREPEQPTADEENLNQIVTSWMPVMIELLPKDQREAVKLYEIDGLPQAEIADRLGISLSGAKSRVQRGRAKIKEMLLDCCTFQLDRRGNVIDYKKNPADTDCSTCSDDC